MANLVKRFLPDFDIVDNDTRIALCAVLLRNERVDGSVDEFDEKMQYSILLRILYDRKFFSTFQFLLVFSVLWGTDLADVIKRQMKDPVIIKNKNTSGGVITVLAQNIIKLFDALELLVTIIDKDEFNASSMLVKVIMAQCLLRQRGLRTVIYELVPISFKLNEDKNIKQQLRTIYEFLVNAEKDNDYEFNLEAEGIEIVKTATGASVSTTKCEEGVGQPLLITRMMQFIQDCMTAEPEVDDSAGLAMVPDCSAAAILAQQGLFRRMALEHLVENRDENYKLRAAYDNRFGLVQRVY